MSMGEYIALYLIGVGVIWSVAWIAVQDEPTTHGQDILFPMGCITGLLWPLVLAYFILGSPFFAWMLWKTRGER